jgi:uncharacterized protein
MGNHESTLRESNKKLVQQYLSTAFEPDWWGLFDEAVVMEFPYGPSLGMPDRFEGREAVTGYLKKMLQQLGTLKFRDIEVLGTEDPGLFVNEYKATLRTPRGTTYDQVYISKIRVKDGKVVMYREFWDPARVTQAVGKYTAA